MELGAHPTYIVMLASPVGIEPTFPRKLGVRCPRPLDDGDYVGLLLVGSAAQASPMTLVLRRVRCWRPWLVSNQRFRVRHGVLGH